MKKILSICLCALGAAAISFAACGGDEVTDYLDGMKSSADRAVTVDAEVYILDGDVTVYTLIRHMEVDTETRTASVSDTKTTLTEDFEENISTSTVSVENVTGQTIVGLNISTSNLAQYEIKDGNLNCTVSADKISEVLTKTVSASSEMTLCVYFENGNLTKAEYSYLNSSSRTVSVTVTYGY